MKSIYIKMKDGRTYHHKIDATFRQCQFVMYAKYGRLNIARIRFCVDGHWIESPYLVNRLAAYNA